MCLFLGWNLPGITIVLQSFHIYFGITVKSRKNRIIRKKNPQIHLIKSKKKHDDWTICLFQFVDNYSACVGFFRHFYSIVKNPKNDFSTQKFFRSQNKIRAAWHFENKLGILEVNLALIVINLLVINRSSLT